MQGTKECFLNFVGKPVFRATTWKIKNKMEGMLKGEKEVGYEDVN